MIRLLALSLLSLMLSAPAIAKGGNKMYEVTITNITKNQAFTPFLVATHRSDFSLFTPGDAAMPELATLAESGGTDDLQALLDGMPDLVSDTNTSGGLLMPGESVTVEIDGNSKHGRLSFAAMLIPTNDTFVGLNSMDLPKKWATTVVPAYDAGSEINDELCAHIPGPVCGGEGVGDPMISGEGSIYIGNGIRGIGDLEPADYDWNNPVALVEVRRVH